MNEPTDETIVVDSLRQAARLFMVAPDTIRQWATTGRLDATKEGNRWIIRIPPDHPDLPGYKGVRETLHFPGVDQISDERDLELARVTAERDRLLDEVTFLRGQTQEYQRQLPELAMRLVEQLRPALPPPDTSENRRRWYWLWLR